MHILVFAHLLSWGKSYIGTYFQLYSFLLSIKVSRYPAYKDLLQLGKERPNALFLDIGCGVGNDTRKVVADGFPAKQVIASDLFPGEYIELSRVQHYNVQHPQPSGTSGTRFSGPRLRASQ